jgi:hypothetical protein
MRRIFLIVLTGCGGRIDNENVPTDAGSDNTFVLHDSGKRGDGSVLPEASACTIPNDPSPGATEAWGSTCSEGQNTSYPIEDNCGGGSVAWEYVPKHDLIVRRIELNVTGGGVALYDSDCDRPTTKLWEGSFGGRGPRDWRGDDVSPGIRLVASHPYFIEQIVPENTSDVCSAATGGVAQRQFNPPGFMGADWTGPYIWLNWTAHVIGDCP